jgi:uncharacterized protein YxjI
MALSPGELEESMPTLRRIFRLCKDNDILNDAGEPVYEVDGKVLSLHGLLVANDR